MDENYLTSLAILDERTFKPVIKVEIKRDTKTNSSWLYNIIATDKKGEKHVFCPVYFDNVNYYYFVDDSWNGPLQNNDFFDKISDLANEKYNLNNK